MWWRAWTAVLVAVLVVASPACRGADSAAPTGSDPTIARATTTTDPYAVPEVIDAAYVNRVLAGLEAVEGDVLRMTMQTGTFPKSARERLRAIYSSDQEFSEASERHLLELREGFPGIRNPPGDLIYSVIDLISHESDSACLFAEVSADLRHTSVSPITVPNGLWIALERTDPSLDPNSHNRTGWSYLYAGRPSDGSRPTNPCDV